MTSDAAFLALYREKRQQLSMLRRWMAHLTDDGAPSGVTGFRAERQRGTNDPLAARMQLLDGLEEEAEHLAAEVSAMEQRFHGIAGLFPEGSRERDILHLYYRLGQPDAMCAGCMGVSVRHACRLRHRMLEGMK